MNLSCHPALDGRDPAPVDPTPPLAPPDRRRAGPRARRLPAGVIVLGLCAGLGCVDAAAQAGRPASSDPVAPLLADDGSAYPSAHRWAAAEDIARARAPGWASRAQRDQLESLHPQRVVRLDAARLDGGALPVLDAGAWVFVEGVGEPALRAARRLIEAGHGTVWVMLPEPADRSGASTQAAHGGRP